MPKLDISVELYNYRPHTAIKRGLLEITCKGEDCNDQFINTIGRIAVERLPMYAYAGELIKITQIDPESGFCNSVAFNNDMLRCRLINTPVMNIDPGFAILHERYWKNINYSDPNRPIHEKEKRIEVNIDTKNTTNDILHVTTNDASIYVDNVLTQLYDKEYPLLIVSLKPKEQFKCSMRAVLGVGQVHTSWDACSNFCYDQETIPGCTIVKFQSASQFNEFILVERSLDYFSARTKLLKEEIKRLYHLNKTDSDRFQIEINDETHTMGEPINYEIQSHPDIMKSSVTRPNLLLKQIIIDIVAYDKTKLLSAVMESIDNLSLKIDTFKEKFKNIQTKSSEMPEKKTKKNKKN